MDLKTIVKETGDSFFIIFTVTTLLNTVLWRINGTETVSTVLNFRILLLSVATALAGFVFYSRRELTRRETAVRYVLHFGLVMGMVLGFARLLHWVDWTSLRSVVVLVVLTAAVYFTVHGIVFFQTKKLADQLNEKLKERYKDG